MNQKTGDFPRRLMPFYDAVQFLLIIPFIHNLNAFHCRTTRRNDLSYFVDCTAPPFLFSLTLRPADMAQRVPLSLYLLQEVPDPL